jgi:hypothetical protein
MLVRGRVKRDKAAEPIMGGYDQTARGFGLSNDHQHEPVQPMGRFPD